MRKIVIFNVKYSTNVGDGVIAECMEAEIARLSPMTKIITADIGGREGFGDSGVIKSGGLKNFLKAALGLLPEAWAKKMKARVSEQAIESQFKPRWRRQMRNADLIVIGGGQLLAAAEDYFPPRIRAVCELATELKIPFCVHAVGMSDPDKFSEQARKIFRECFADSPFFIGGSVRDADSVKNWEKLLPERQIGLARDPGLTAGFTYQPIAGQAQMMKKSRKTGKKIIALGVIAPSVIEAHAAQSESAVSVSREFFTQLGVGLSDAGFAVTFFTNGAPEDQAYLQSLKTEAFSGREIYFAPRPLSPKDLAGNLAPADCVVAHRMHAVIVSYAFGIPTVGLVWDKKMRSFYESVGAGDFALSSDATVKTVIETVKKALDEPLSEQMREIHAQEARSGLSALLQITAQDATGNRQSVGAEKMIAREAAGV